MAIRAGHKDHGLQIILFGILAVAILLMTRQSAPGKSFNVQNITVAEAKQLIDGGAVVVDVRDASAYEARHIPEAMSIPLDALKQAIPASLVYAKTKAIVVYCGDGVSIGPEGTALLTQAGYINAVNLKSGIQGWAAAGMPVKSANGGS